MPRILVQFDAATLKAIDRFALATQRKRAEFIRKVVNDALFLLEAEKMRDAYLRQPDTGDDAESWELPEEWKP